MNRAICVIGNLNVDLVLGTLDDWPEQGTETFLDNCDLRPGGSAANTAIALSRLGTNAGLLSATGSDSMADMLGARFRGPLDRIARLDGQTGISVGVLHSGAERSFLSFNGHLNSLDLGMVLKLLEDWPLDGALALVSGGFAMPRLAPDCCALLDHLRLAGAETAIDPGWPGEGWTTDNRRQVMAWARRCDHMLLNDKELTGFTNTDDIERASETLRPQIGDACNLVVKRGAQGASLWRGATVHHATAPRTNPFDTVGAGDAFNAGYLAAVAAGTSSTDALHAGTATASRLISEFPREIGPLTAPLVAGGGE